MKRPRTKIMDQRHISRARDLRQSRGIDPCREALNAIIGGMYLENEAGVRDRARSCRRSMRAVRRAHFDQLRAGAQQDVRHAERAANLDQFAARPQPPRAMGETVEHKKDRPLRCYLRPSRLRRR